MRKSKRKNNEEHENHERWLVSYADFITLLFAFFTILYATAEKNVGKQEEFQESVKKSFASVSGYFSEGSGDGLEGASGNTISSDGSLDSSGGNNFGLSASERATFVEKIKGELESEMGAESFSDYVDEIREIKGGIKLSLASNLLFKSGSYKVEEKALQALRGVGRMVARKTRNTKQKIIVEGHTDSDSTGSQVIGNWELASLRATTIVRYLESSHKLNPRKLLAISYGDSRPVATNDTVRGRRSNRRIEILIVSGNLPL